MEYQTLEEALVRAEKFDCIINWSWTNKGTQFNDFKLLKPCIIVGDEENDNWYFQRGKMIIHVPTLTTKSISGEDQILEITKHSFSYIEKVAQDWPGKMFYISSDYRKVWRRNFAPQILSLIENTIGKLPNVHHGYTEEELIVCFT